MTFSLRARALARLLGWSPCVSRLPFEGAMRITELVPFLALSAVATPCAAAKPSGIPTAIGRGERSVAPIPTGYRIDRGET